MNSTLAFGLNYIAKEQIKKLIKDLNSDPNSDNNTLYTSVALPMVYTKEQLKTTSPFVSAVPVGNYGVRYNYGRFADLNKNKNIQKQIIKYYLYKILDKWFYHDFRDILGYVKIVDGKASLIRSLNDYNPSTLASDSVENIEKRIDYLEQILVNKKLVKHVLKKIILENELEWVSLNKHQSLIKKVLQKYINSKLETAIKSVKN